MKKKCIDFNFLIFFKGENKKSGDEKAENKKNSPYFQTSKPSFEPSTVQIINMPPAWKPNSNVLPKPSSSIFSKRPSFSKLQSEASIL